MDRIVLRAAVVFVALLAFTAHAGTGVMRYVNVNSPTPASPYTNWATAAQVIQDALDVAAEGDEILVTNGCYNTGGRAVRGTMTNRVAIGKPLRVLSVNGPAFTSICGFQVPDTTNGDGAIRCVYLTNGAILSGFTLTNGATRAAGDYVYERSGGGVWCDPKNAVVTNCVVTGNSASDSGGGVYQGTLTDCTLRGNRAGGLGGGAYKGIMNRCALTRNAASDGGGACSAVLNNCTIDDNWAANGGGVSSSSLTNCFLTGNSADFLGGGSYSGNLSHCTITRNSAFYEGGGTCYSGLNNCIIYFNRAVSNANYNTSSSLSYCCTTPQPPSGIGNISVDPQLSSLSHLSGNSPCRAAALAGSGVGTDIDGEPWASPPSIGCDEYHAGAVTGALSVTISAPAVTVRGYGVEFAARIDGRTTASVWYFSDGIRATNQTVVSRTWAAVGYHQVVLGAFNESFPSGVMATTVVHVVESTIHYVDARSVNPTPPFPTWDTAARSIQEAVDAALGGDEIVVGDGVYASGGRALFRTMTNRVAIDKPLRVRSVNGPAYTIIEGHQVPVATNGDGAIRCVYLANGATLSGFTVSNGATCALMGGDIRELNGGGVYCQSILATVSNSVFVRNSAQQDGGGAYSGALYNCTLQANVARANAGGAFAAKLYNSFLVGNWARAKGGGACSGLLSNCNITLNYAKDSGGGAWGAELVACMVVSNRASYYGGGVCSNVLTDCHLQGNLVSNYGGGASGATLSNCVIRANTGTWGGGTESSTLYQCTITENLAVMGGGSIFSTHYNCMILSNSASTIYPSWRPAGGGGSGGGLLVNCLLRGNYATDHGGGASGGTLHNCTVTGNSAPNGAGGYLASMNNCTIAGNKAPYDYSNTNSGIGGGARECWLTNCIIYCNTAAIDGSNYYRGTLDHCCTSPNPGVGTPGGSNFSMDPLFLDWPNANLRLKSNSPCIDAGVNGSVTIWTDLDGRPRLVGGTVDVGAYEYQAGVDGLYLGWLPKFGLPTDGSGDLGDADYDGLNNWQEWRCGTNPTNANSALRLLTPGVVGSNLVLSWQSVTGRYYALERSTCLLCTSRFLLRASNLVGHTGTSSYTDTNAAGKTPAFYRLLVQ